jgi:hypothetical protein
LANSTNTVRIVVHRYDLRILSNVDGRMRSISIWIRCALYHSYRNDRQLTIRQWHSTSLLNRFL